PDTLETRRKKEEKAAQGHEVVVRKVTVAGGDPIERRGQRGGAAREEGPRAVRHEDQRSAEERTQEPQVADVEEIGANAGPLQRQVREHSGAARPKLPDQY